MRLPTEKTEPAPAPVLLLCLLKRGRHCRRCLGQCWAEGGHASPRCTRCGRGSVKNAPSSERRMLLAFVAVVIVVVVISQTNTVKSTPTSAAAAAAGTRGWSAELLNRKIVRPPRRLQALEERERFIFRLKRPDPVRGRERRKKIDVVGVLEERRSLLFSPQVLPVKRTVCGKECRIDGRFPCRLSACATTKLVSANHI